MTLRGSRRVLHDVLLDAVQEDSQAPLVTFIGDRTYSRFEIYDDALKVAGAIQRAGILPGERVAIMVANRVEFLTAWVATSMVGTVVVPLNTAMRGTVLTHMLDLTEPRLIIGEGQFAPHIVQALGDANYVQTMVWLDGEGREDGTSYEDFLAGAVRAEPAAAEPWELAGIYFTSGTTGPSKGVMWCQNMAIAMAESAQQVMGYGPSDVVFTCLPLFHANALCTGLLAAVLARASVVVAPRFSASQFWQQVTESGATTANLLGSMAPILWRQEPSDWETRHSLRLALVIPPPVDHFDEFEARFSVQCTELYGLTDANIPIGMPFGERRPGSCGKPLKGYECMVADEMDQPMPVGQSGELLVRSTLPFILQLGYWRMPEATVEAWRNLWFHTGDLVRMDEDGYYYFLDRSKDAIRRFGENISSFEVEQVLISHPAILEAAVYAVPSELSEDEVMASVILLPGVQAVPEEILAWCEQRLAYFAVPRYLDIRTALPKTQTEKVQKSVLRQEGVTTTAFDRGPSGRRMREKARLQEATRGTP